MRIYLAEDAANWPEDGSRSINMLRRPALLPPTGLTGLLMEQRPGDMSISIEINMCVKCLLLRKSGINVRQTAAEIDAASRPASDHNVFTGKTKRRICHQQDDTNLRKFNSHGKEAQFHRR